MVAGGFDRAIDTPDEKPKDARFSEMIRHEFDRAKHAVGCQDALTGEQRFDFSPTVLRQNL